MLMLQGGEYEGRKKNLIDDENLRLFLLDEAETILDDEATRRWLFSTRRKSSDAAQSKAVSLARKIEAQLDEQMHSYRRLFSTKSDGAESDLEAGIDLLLRQLQQVNAQMQAWICSGGSEMVSHTLTRHQEILQDLTQEFDRHRSSLRTKQEHALLLEDFKEFDRARLDLESGDGSTKQALLNEHVGINRNTAQIDGVISQAHATLVLYCCCG
ncbi:BnaC05g09520D [Brassica napus]|uniref:(rape) hypothetical protein n=1 Tax=Brassica napus TaxID=3708 RepID=A0A078GZR1_BRANA|nr:unnamed protein product [Brassica napus]CDY30068.1 BnaC05g09520D [Brassica napus]